MIRLVPDQSSQIKRTAQITFYFDGEERKAHVGETIGVAMLRTGRKHLRNSPVRKAPRGMFCCMGLCQECVVRIDGTVVEACRHLVAEGLIVESIKEL